MKNIISTFLIAGFLFGTLNVLWSQQIPISNHYLYNNKLYNPAATGVDGGQVTLNYRQQFLSIEENRPNTILLNVGLAPIKSADRFGVGLNLVYDEAGLIGRTDISALFAYQLVNTDNVLLSAGIKAGYLLQQMNFGDILDDAVDNGVDATDQVFLNENVTEGTFQGGPGLYFRYTLEDGHQIKVDAAMPQLLTSDLEYQSDGSTATFVSENHLIYNVSFYANVADGVAIEPHFMGRGILGDKELKAGMFDLSLRAHFIDALWVGLGYRSGLWADQDGINTAGIYGAVGLQFIEDLTLFLSVEGRSALGMTVEVGGSYNFNNAPSAPVFTDPVKLRTFNENLNEATESIYRAQELIPLAQFNLDAATKAYEDVEDGRVDSPILQQDRITEAYSLLENAKEKYGELENELMTAQNLLGQSEKINDDVENSGKTLSSKEASALKRTRGEYNNAKSDANLLKNRIASTRREIQRVENEFGVGKDLIPSLMEDGKVTALENYFQTKLNLVNNLPYDGNKVSVAQKGNQYEVTYSYADEVLEYNVQKDLPKVQSLLNHIVERIEQLDEENVTVERIILKAAYQGDVDELEDEADFQYQGDYRSAINVNYDVVELSNSGTVIGRTEDKRQTINTSDELTIETLAVLKLYGMQEYLDSQQNIVTENNMDLEVTAPNSQNLSIQVNDIIIVISK